LLLRMQEQLSYAEISEVTGRTEGNVGCILHNAVRKLAKLVKTKTEEKPQSLNTKAPSFAPSPSLGATEGGRRSIRTPAEADQRGSKI
jgi:hypothetical protein